MNTKNWGQVYALINRNTGEVFYIGSTTTSLKTRLNDHKSQARYWYKHDYHGVKSQYIRRIGYYNIDIIRLTRRITIDMLTTYEAYAIKFARQNNVHLLNELTPPSIHWRYREESIMWFIRERLTVQLSHVVSHMFDTIIEKIDASVKHANLSRQETSDVQTVI